MQLKIAISINGRKWFSIEQIVNLTQNEVLRAIHRLMRDLTHLAGQREKTENINQLFNSR